LPHHHREELASRPPRDQANPSLRLIRVLDAERPPRRGPFCFRRRADKLPPRNELINQPLMRMPDDLRSQIIAEMKRVESEIDQQKRLIKNNVENKLVIETAEQEMRALHTRLSALEANLAKEEAAD
jgi:hypothetical protein